jgi:hypothetical protein
MCIAQNWEAAQHRYLKLIYLKTRLKLNFYIGGETPCMTMMVVLFLWLVFRHQLHLRHVE